MKFSIVVPTCNAEKYLCHALFSIIDQNVETEIIVIDGASTDCTVSLAHAVRDMCKAFYPHVTLIIVSEKDNGEPDAINKGLKLCTGDMVAYLDADDVYLPGAFERVQKQMGQASWRWCYGKGEIIDHDGKESRGVVTVAKEYLQKRYSLRALYIVDFIVQPSVFWRREFLQFVGGPYITEKLVFDYEWLIRTAIAAPPMFINEYLSAWRAHTGSSTTIRYEKQARDARRIQRAYYRHWLQEGVFWGTIMLYKGLSRERAHRRAKTPLGQSSD